MVDWKYQEEKKPSKGPDWTTIPYPPEPTLQSERLVLRQTHIKDAPILAEQLNNPKILSVMSNRLPDPYKLSDAEWFINHLHEPIPIQTQFTIVSNERGHPVGMVGLDPGPDVFVRTAELGYWIAESCWRKGYMSEAVHLIIDWGFNLEGGICGKDLSLLRISATVYGGNESSVGVLRKVGFVLEGRMKDAVWKNGEVKDLLMFGLTRSEWEKVKRSGEKA